jgi:BREX system ATP-binding protein BrxC/D
VTSPLTPDPERIRPRDRDAVLSSLRAGVVPLGGHRHIQVGRAAEVRALSADIDRIADGGTAVRFVIGEYGAGKTFFLHLVRSIALERRLVTMHGDLTPDRRLQAGAGQARSMYGELARNMSTRAKPEGGALASVVERFVTSALGEAKDAGRDVEEVITERLDSLSELVGGYDFAAVVAAYWRGHDTGNDRLRADAVRWLRGEFTTRTDARAALGVRTIVDDNNWYDHVKLLARFVRLAGFSGLLIGLDELVNLYKLSHTASRNANYEQVLRIVNDSLQGGAQGLGWLLSGTPDFLLDTHRGLYSYPALHSRLAENDFATGGLVDYSGPVIRLANLTPEDLYILLGKLRHVYAAGDPGRYPVGDDALSAFMAHCASRIGDAYFRTPRSTIKEWVGLLAVVDQNPGVDWRGLIGDVRLVSESDPDEANPDDPRADDDELRTFRL